MTPETRDQWRNRMRSEARSLDAFNVESLADWLGISEREADQLARTWEKYGITVVNKPTTVYGRVWRWGY